MVAAVLAGVQASLPLPGRPCCAAPVCNPCCAAYAFLHYVALNQSFKQPPLQVRTEVEAKKKEVMDKQAG